MTEVTKTKTNIAGKVLQATYKNVRMAADSIINLMPKVNDEKLKSDLTVQLSAYEAFASRTAKLMDKEGVKPEEEGTLTKMSAKWGTMMNTMMDSTSTHLAKMVIEGATMGVNDMMEQIRDAKRGDVSEDVIRLAQDVCDYEERTVEQMRSYLR